MNDAFGLPQTVVVLGGTSEIAGIVAHKWSSRAPEPSCSPDETTRRSLGYQPLSRLPALGRCRR